MTDPNYLARLKLRQHVQEKDSLANFGVMTGGVLSIYSGFRLIYVVDDLDSWWRFILVLGATLFFAGLIYPRVLLPLHQVLQKLMGWIGKSILKFLLTLLYFGLVAPLGLLMRRIYGSAPIYQWKKEIPSNTEGWTKKDILLKNSMAVNFLGLNNLLQPINILTHFIRYKNYFLVPIVIILITLGLLVFFASSSVLAPMIYTLF